MPAPSLIVDTHCSICKDEKRREFVGRLIAAHHSAYAISRRSRSQEAADHGIEPMKDSTILRHMKHMVDTHGVSKEVAVGRMEAIARLDGHVGTSAQRSEDVAALVARKVRERLEDETDPLSERLTIKDGLQAQSILDRREEKRKQNELAHAVAKMLLRNVTPPDAIIEGHAVLVDES